MWGFYNARNRFLAFHILNLIVNSQSYNPKVKNQKGYDQFFLTSIYWLLKNDAIIHDSYTCKQFGGSAFPTERVGNCFIGGGGDCDPNGWLDPCPVECRPKNHLDWESC